MNFFEISTSSQTNLTQDPMVTCIQKNFFLKFGTCTRLEHFGWKHSSNHLGVKFIVVNELLTLPQVMY